MRYPTVFLWYLFCPLKILYLPIQLFYTGGNFNCRPTGQRTGRGLDFQLMSSNFAVELKVEGDAVRVRGRRCGVDECMKYMHGVVSLLYDYYIPK